ncbi:hypothetical protein [Moraxella oblonga]|uniref:hypothetical protein n=1 Tax=Moraxella oblonga TaxID=200413 RepID=UPI0008347559|nr:hypothetical protein [Moraxella oblonga]
MLKQFVVSISCVSVLALSGCGFALRGTDKSLHVAPQHQSVELTSDETADAFALKQPLTKHLQVRGITTNSANNHIHLQNVRFRRYDFVGTLTEVRLVLMADVVYQFGDKKYQYPLQVERSYQYNEASVVTDDGQDRQTRVWLYDHLSERIAEQYRAIAKSIQ